MWSCLSPWQMPTSRSCNTSFKWFCKRNRSTRNSLVIIMTDDDFLKGKIAFWPLSDMRSDWCCTQIAWSTRLQIKRRWLRPQSAGSPFVNLHGYSIQISICAACVWHLTHNSAQTFCLCRFLFVFLNWLRMKKVHSGTQRRVPHS